MKKENEKNNNEKIVRFEKNNKNNEEITIKEDDSVLFVDGEKIDLESFVLSGLTKDNNTVVLSINSNIQEALYHKSVLSYKLQEELGSILDED